MQKLLLCCVFVWAAASLSAQLPQYRTAPCKLQGNDFIKLDYIIQNGDSVFKKYEKHFRTVEAGDSILYVEQFDVNREWYLFRYKVNNGKPSLNGRQQQFDLDGKNMADSFCNDSTGNCDYSIKYSYFPNGQLLSKTGYKKNVLHGVSYFYHNNGQLKNNLEYNDGKLWNILAYYDQNGNPLDAGNFCDGNGTVLVYSTTGKLIKVKLYKNGKEKSSNTIRSGED